MTATDELRRLLDERGIEHMDFNMPERSLTLFAGDEHDGAYTENSVDTILTVYGASPAQAVEATLGSDLKAENAKLRELVLDYEELTAKLCDSRECDGCPFDTESTMCKHMHMLLRVGELGVDV